MQDVWIGLNDIDTEGTYIWNDGTSGSFRMYAPNEPEGQPADADCFCQQRSGLWNDVECGQTFAYVCKIPSFTSGGGKYSFFKDATKDWFEAKLECESLGQTLVTIESQAENDYLSAEIMKR